jgi:predicted nuclease with TOPRIM domain
MTISIGGCSSEPMLDCSYSILCCPDCRNKYQGKLSETMKSVFDEFVEDINNENEELREGNLESHKQKEIKRLNEQLDKIKNDIKKLSDVNPELPETVSFEWGVDITDMTIDENLIENNINLLEENQP